MTSFVFLFLFIALTACSNSLTSGTSAVERPVIAQATGCETFFDEKWCSQNKSVESNVRQICPGTVMIQGDMMFPAIKLHKDNEQICLAGLEGGSDTTADGCARAISRKYSRLNDQSGEVIECYDRDSNLIGVSGFVGNLLFSAAK